MVLVTLYRREIRREEKSEEEHVLLQDFQTQLLINSIEMLVLLFGVVALSRYDCHQRPFRLGLFFEKRASSALVSVQFSIGLSKVLHKNLKQRVDSTVRPCNSLFSCCFP